MDPDNLTDRVRVAEKFLGASPMQNRKLYFESSPISYATIDRNKASFMLVNGTADDIRRFRQDLMAYPDGTPLKKVCNSTDFFTTNEPLELSSTRSALFWPVAGS